MTKNQIHDGKPLRNIRGESSRSPSNDPCVLIVQHFHRENNVVELGYSTTNKRQFELTALQVVSF